ncbi:MAG: hypothetical protein QM642_09920 [Edaphocola sp.]
MKKKCSTFILMSFLAVVGCKKNNEGVPSTATGSVNVSFENCAGDSTLQLSSSTTDFLYANAAGQAFNVSTYKYYISNIKLLKGDEVVYAEPESYHLIDQSDKTSWQFTLGSVPAGEYDKINLLIGVDSTRNTSGAQTGALDVLYGMFWDWNSGYIMAKLEGSTSAVTSKRISFHTGGYSGEYSVLQDVTLTLPSNLTIGDSTTSSLAIKSDVLKWFEGTNTIDFTEMSQVTAGGLKAFIISQNYASMLSVKSVSN